MKRFVLVLLLVFSLSTIVFSQSGRRVTPLPKPVPEQKSEDLYSESRSNKPVRLYPPNYKEKKKKKKKKNKKDKKSKKGETVQPVANTPEINEDDIIKVDATLVTIPVSIHTKSGLYISDVREDEVKIFENGKEQELAYFRISEKPFTVALVIDTSPSTAYKIEEIRNSAKAFVQQLKPDDKVLVMEFDSYVRVLTEATTNRQKIYRAIDKARFGGGTALYTAVDFVINRRLSRIEGRKAIVLFTDGVDTASIGKNYFSTLRDVEESDAIIFPIYYNTFLSTTTNINGGAIPSIRNRGNGTSADEYARGKAYLEGLANSTGGRVFQPKNNAGGLTRAFEGIAEELRRQYNVGYYPNETGKVGERRKIKVRIYRPKLIIRARDSYIVGEDN